MKNTKILMRYITDNKYLMLFVIYLISKYMLYKKLGSFYFQNIYIENDFFPSILYSLNPFYLDVITVVVILLRNKYAYLLGLFCCLLQVIHPESFGSQHSVVSFYMFLWLFIDSLKKGNHQIMLGRVIVSFLFIGAFLGKLTPGWISGQHPRQFLTHIQEWVHTSYLLLVGEFLVAISFLLPFTLGILIPLIVLSGMIASISFAIFDAIGPIVGILFTLVIFKSHKAEPLSIYFDKNCRICKNTFSIFKFLNSKYLHLSYVQDTTTELDHNKTVVHIAATSKSEKYLGYDTYCEAFARIPILSFFYPFMKSKLIANWGRKTYRQATQNRSCKTL